MRFRCSSLVLEDECLRRMKSGEVSSATRRVIVFHREHAARFVERFMSFGKEMSGFRFH